jgi:anti-sigma regulatory factor (Ser/Thr protein kinase)
MAFPRRASSSKPNEPHRSRCLELQCRTREEAEALVDEVAALLPEPGMYRFGLMELLLNAIEHGNLEIGTTLKGQLLREHRFEEELAARLANETYRARRVHVSVVRADATIEIEIRDEGPGFAWRNALSAGLELSEAPNGRGIALVRQTCFPTLTYRDPGNVAVVTLPCPP